MDAPTALADILSLNQMAMHTVVDGFSADQLVTEPGQGGTPAMWILGHIAVNRVRLAHHLGSSIEEVAEPAWAAGFETGSTPPAAGDAYPPVAEVLELYDHAHSLAVVGLANMTEEQLEEEPLFNGKNRLEHTLYIAWHEAYHLGQFGPIRRTLGLPKLA